MTPTPRIAQEAEQHVRALVELLEEPQIGECLCCYVARLLVVAPCDGTLRHASRYRDLRVPRATALARRLGLIGAYCDCEIFWNGYQPQAVLRVDDDSDLEFDSLPACSWTRRGSIRPCKNWVRIRRGE